MNNILANPLASEDTRKAAKSFSESEGNASVRASMRLCDVEKQLLVQSEPSGFGSQEE